MRLIALLLSLTILSSNAALFKKKQASTPIHTDFLSEFTHIDKTYASSSNKYKVKADIIIPADSDSFQLMLHYDELSDMAVKDVSWLSGRKATVISPVTTDSSVNTQLERILNRGNPGLAYDRMQTGKHVITKTYIFKKSKVFPSKKAETHKLKITWINNAVIYVPVENLYLGVAEPTASPKARPTVMSQAPSPRGSQPRMPSPNPQSETVKQDRQYEYEMLEIESTLRQMKEATGADDMPSEQFMPMEFNPNAGVPQLPEF